MYNNILRTKCKLHSYGRKYKNMSSNNLASSKFNLTYFMTFALQCDNIFYERPFVTMPSTLYRANAIILVYDITDEVSFYIIV